MIAIPKPGKKKSKRVKIRKLKTTTLKGYPLAVVMKIYDDGVIVRCPQLDVVLDRLYSTWVRRRQGGECVLFHMNKPWTCGGVITNGHVFSRQCSYLKYNEENTWPTCWSCNNYHSQASNHIYYHEWLRARIGKEKYEQMERDYRKYMAAPHVVDTGWYTEKIAYYRALVNL